MMNTANGARWVFILSLVSLLYWVLASFILNVYKIAFVGAVFELLWFPMILLLVILPILSFIQLAKLKFKPNSIPFFSLLISIGVISLLTTSQLWK